VIYGLRNRKIAIFGYTPLSFKPTEEGFPSPSDDLRKIFRGCQRMAKQGTKRRRKIAKIFNRLIEYSAQTLQTDDRRTGDCIAKVNRSSRSLKMGHVMWPHSLGPQGSGPTPNYSLDTSHSARNLGFIFDEHFTLSDHWQRYISLQSPLLSHSSASLYPALPWFLNCLYHCYLYRLLHTWLL